jgi:HK97 gp10 family phage protein
MATKGSLNLNGLSAYLEELARAGKDVDEAAGRALVKGAEPILDEMEKLVPVGDPAVDPHPGNLRNHLAVDGPHQDGNFISVDVGVINADEDTGIYGNVQEYGSASNEAQPYIRPSLKGKKSAAMRAMKESLKGEGFTA